LEESNWSTVAVGNKKANELGIHDMSGNVWEWISDWYGNYTENAKINPTGSVTGSHRVIRGGGGWYSHPGMASTVYNRDFISPDTRLSLIGFRLALSPTPNSIKERPREIPQK
jgi:formylglycine-generating enzyme required for sulfatase activity